MARLPVPSLTTALTSRSLSASHCALPAHVAQLAVARHDFDSLKVRSRLAATSPFRAFALASTDDTHHAFLAGSAGQIQAFKLFHPQASVADEDELMSRHEADFLQPVASAALHSRWVSDVQVLRSRRPSYVQSDTLLASSSDDGSIALWRMQSSDLSGDSSLECVHQFASVHDGAGVYTLHAHRHDEGMVVSGGKDGTVRLTRLAMQSSSVSSSYSRALEGHSGVVKSVRVHDEDSNLVASTGNDKTVRLWDVRDSSCAAVCHGAHDLAINSVRWRPFSGSQLATSSFDGTVKMWDVRRLDHPLQCLSGHWPKSAGRASVILHPEFIFGGTVIMISAPKHGQVVLYPCTGSGKVSPLRRVNLGFVATHTQSVGGGRWWFLASQKRAVVAEVPFV